MTNTRNTMMNTTATTTTATTILTVNDFYRRVIAQAEKELRYKARDHRYLSSFDMKLVRDQIAEKALRYFDTYDPSKAKVETLVSRITRTTFADYVDKWMHYEGRTESLDTLLGWTGDSETDEESYSSPSTLYQDAAERFRDYESEADDEAGDWAKRTRLIIKERLSENDQRALAMLENGDSRDEMAQALGCSRNAVDKRVHDTRERAQKALGCHVVRSRKAHREIADTNSVDLPVLVLYFRTVATGPNLSCQAPSALSLEA